LAARTETARVNGWHARGYGGATGRPEPPASCNTMKTIS